MFQSKELCVIFSSGLSNTVLYYSTCSLIYGTCMCTHVLVNTHTCNLVCIDGHNLFISQTGLHETKSMSFTLTMLKTSRIVETPTCWIQNSNFFKFFKLYIFLYYCVIGMSLYSPYHGLNSFYTIILLCVL